MYEKGYLADQVNIKQTNQIKKKIKKKKGGIAMFTI